MDAGSPQTPIQRVAKIVRTKQGRRLKKGEIAAGIVKSKFAQGQGPKKVMNSRKSIEKQLDANEEVIMSNAEELNKKLIAIGAPAVVTTDGGAAHVQNMPVCGLPNYPSVTKKGRITCKKGTGKQVKNGLKKQTTRILMGKGYKKVGQSKKDVKPRQVQAAKANRGEGKKTIATLRKLWSAKVMPALGGRYSEATLIAFLGEVKVPVPRGTKITELKRMVLRRFESHGAKKVSSPTY
jgi:hypothetical protein